MKTIGVSAWGLFCAAALALLGLNCGSSVDVVAGNTASADKPAVASSAGADAPPDIARKPGPDDTPDPAETVAGQFLARVNVTATHSVEFWELQPGNVLVVQALNSAAGEHRLELEDLLQASGGLYGGLYRTLLNDENATIPSGLAAADEHRRQLPIRDASLPLPSVPLAPDVSLRLGPAIADSAPPVAQSPGALQTLGLHHTGGGIYGIFDLEPGFCTWVKADSWCPPGSYGNFVNGNIQETIFWDALGHNPQTSGGAAASDTMVVNQIVYGSGLAVWSTVFTYGLLPGHTVEAYAGANPTIYQGQITGSVVSYGERWRLSFPSIVTSGRSPDNASAGFTSGLNGITHTNNAWIMSRTQGPGLYSYSDCVGSFSFANDLQTYSGSRCPVEITQLEYFNYLHLGDLVYDPPNAPAGVAAPGGTGLLYLSTNQPGSGSSSSGTFGSVAVLSADMLTYYGVTTFDGIDQVAWVAIDRRTRDFYTSSSSGREAWPTIHRHTISVSAPWDFYNGYVRSVEEPSIQLLNAALANPGNFDIQGGKVSSHGKLWVWVNGTNQLLGIDPYSGIIQVSWTYNTGYPEAEGLDITEDNLPLSPHVGGQIHLQHLDDGVFSANWQMLNLVVSDLSRL